MALAGYFHCFGWILSGTYIEHDGAVVLIKEPPKLMVTCVATSEYGTAGVRRHETFRVVGEDQCRIRCM